jgi:hypothetical protein
MILIGILLYYLKMGIPVDNELREVVWDKQGKLVSLNYFIDSTKAFIFMQDSNLLSISYHHHYKFEDLLFTFNSKGEKILQIGTIKDTSYFTYYYPDNKIREEFKMIKVKGVNYFYGDYSYFHNNGELFISGQFKLNDSDYIINKGNSPCIAKDGIWKFYDLNGDFIKMENFINGNLKEKKVRKFKYKRFISRMQKEKYILLCDFEQITGRRFP